MLLLFWIKRSMRHKNHLETLALMLIFSGALGNIIDRIDHGYVIDFISLHYDNWYFPTFNIADSIITLGTLCLCTTLFFFPTHR